MRDGHHGHVVRLASSANCESNPRKRALLPSPEPRYALMGSMMTSRVPSISRRATSSGLRCWARSKGTNSDVAVSGWKVLMELMMAIRSTSAPAASRRGRMVSLGSSSADSSTTPAGLSPRVPRIGPAVAAGNPRGHIQREKRFAHARVAHNERQLPQGNAARPQPLHSLGN